MEETTAQRILSLLKRAGGGLEVKELCRELDLTHMAVRRQLSLLERRGLTFRKEQKREIGRPAGQYFLTEKGHASFPQDYANLANRLLVAVRTLKGKATVAQIFQHLKADDLQKSRSRISAKTLGAKVHQVCQLLAEKGFMPEWEKIEDDKYLIKLMNCPILGVAKKFPQACVCEQEFLGEVLAANVSRKHYVLQKDQFCSYLIKERAG